MECASAVEHIVVEGRFELERLTEGGMSTIYEGTERSTGQPVIAKMAPSTDFERSSTLIREREMLVRLDHPGVVRCLGLCHQDNMTFLVLEKVDGRDLAEVMRLDDLPLTESRLRDWTVQLARILGWLHTQSPPVIFRDLKPSNILLEPDGQLVLIDFGAARVRAGTSGRDTVPLGTPGYAPPEQYAALGGSTDERADVYALGVTVYELLTRRDPADFSFRFPPASELGVAVTPGFERIVMRMLDPEPGGRYPSMASLLRDLQGGADAPQGPRSPTERALTYLPFVTAGMATTLLPLAASSGEVSWATRYLAAVLILATATAMGAGSRWLEGLCTPQDISRARRLMLYSMVMTVVSLVGAIPAMLPLDVLNGFLRRACLELGASAVPLEAPRTAWWIFSLWLASLGFLGGRSLRVRNGWLAPAALLLFTASCFTPLMVRAARRDLAPQVAADASAPLWKLSFPESLGGPVDMTVLSHRGSDESYVAVKDSPTRFSVVDATSGRVLWSDHSSRFQPLTQRDGEILQASGNILMVRGAKDGAIRWTYAADEPILFFNACDRTYYLQLASGQLVALDELTHKALWKKQASGNNPESTLIPTFRGNVMVLSANDSRVDALDPRTGKVLWSHDVENRKAFHPMDLGDTLLWVTCNGVEGIDKTLGKQRFKFRLPVGEGGPNQFEALRVVNFDPHHLMVQQGTWLYQVQVPEGRLQWKVQVAGERVELRNVGTDSVYLFSGTGKLLGLQGRSGLVTWESWAGNVAEHLWPPANRGFEWVDSVGSAVLVQETGSRLVRAIDPTDGRVIWRQVLPEGLRVRRMLDDGQRFYVLGAMEDGKGLLVAYRRPSVQPGSALNRFVPAGP